MIGQSGRLYAGISVEVLRRTLGEPVASAVSLGDQGAKECFASDAVSAAVLIPIVRRENVLSVLLTVRTAHLYHHPGQISFPGGRQEAGDRSADEVALRETAEEIGLMKEHIEILGHLPSYYTATGFRVIPVVALTDGTDSRLRPDPFEVAEIFEVPLDFLLQRSHWQQPKMFLRGEERQFYAIIWRGYYIWGATAGMLHALVSRLLQWGDARGGRDLPSGYPV